MQKNELMIPLSKLKKIVKTDKKEIFAFLASVTEELGELAQAIKVEEKILGTSKKVLKEDSKSEAVDVVICALAVFYAKLGTDKELEIIFNKKLDKWRKNQLEELQIKK